MLLEARCNENCFCWDDLFYFDWNSIDTRVVYHPWEALVALLVQVIFLHTSLDHDLTSFTLYYVHFTNLLVICESTRLVHHIPMNQQLPFHCIPLLITVVIFNSIAILDQVSENLPEDCHAI